MTTETIRSEANASPEHEHEAIHLSEKEYVALNNMLLEMSGYPEDNPHIVDWMERHHLKFDSGKAPAFFNEEKIWLETDSHHANFLEITPRND